MLRTWLGGRTVDEFLRDDFRRRPLASPGGAESAVPRFEWPVLDRILGRPGLDALVVRGGRASDVSRPRSVDALRALFVRGLGLVIRRAEAHDEGLAALAASLVRDIPGEAHIQLFVTAGGTSGFSWHYDAEDVFIAQTHGTKTYWFRANTVDPTPARDAQPDFARVREERTPIMTCTLVPGDWLYLPRGFWHVARAETDSLSISLGLFPESDHAATIPGQ